MPLPLLLLLLQDAFLPPPKDIFNLPPQQQQQQQQQMLSADHAASQQLTVVRPPAIPGTVSSSSSSSSGLMSDVLSQKLLSPAVLQQLHPPVTPGKSGDALYTAAPFQVGVGRCLYVCLWGEIWKGGGEQTMFKSG
jgi:hypothetical protein